MTKGRRRGSERPIGNKRQAMIRQLFRIVNKTISVVNGAGAPGYGSAEAFRLPEGNILIHGAIGYITLTTSDADITATFDGDISIGTAATADGTLSGSEVNLVASTSLGAATAKVSPNVRLVTSTSTTGVIHDNTAADVIFYFNLLIDDADISGAADFTANGYVEVLYTVLGDD